MSAPREEARTVLLIAGVSLLIFFGNYIWHVGAGATFAGYLLGVMLGVMVGIMAGMLIQQSNERADRPQREGPDSAT